MPQRMVMDQLVRLTLVRKSRATAKHPSNRSGVVEVVKAADLDPVEYDWYSAFEDYIESFDGEPPDDWCEAFDALKLSAKRGKNYPDGAGPFAGPHNSFPISSQHHVYAAARLLGHAAESNQANIKANIIRIAHEKGFKLPKSWVKKVNKSMLPEERVNGLLDVIRQYLTDEAETPVAVEKAEEVAATPEAAVEAEAKDDEKPEEETSESEVTPTPEASEAPEAEAEVVPAEVAAEGEPEAKEAARPAKGHSHSHAHLSSYGYSYSHNHQHGDDNHTNMSTQAHDESEIAHAHEHVEKADSFGEDDIPMLVADRAGLKTDLDTAQAQITALTEKLAALEAKVDAQSTQVEKAEARAQDLYANLLRRPLTLAPTAVEKSQATIDPMNTKWDDAFDIAMGRK